MTHRTLPMVNCIEKVMADHVFNILSDNDSLESIKALFMDNMYLSPRMLKRFSCFFHLPLRFGVKNEYIHTLL